MSINRADFDRVMVPNYAPAAVIPVRGQGAYLWDQEGKQYVDFAGGIAVNCLGHCDPGVVAAVTEQAGQLWHLSNVMTNEPALRLAKRMTRDTFAERVYFANSGAEANEAALKLARRVAHEQYGPEKSDIIAFDKGFHGRTFFTVSVGGQKAYSEGFGPKPSAIKHAQFNDLASVEALISQQTCCVMVEPVQGEGGVLPADPTFMQGLRTLCDRHNALLIFDEVQTGVGRTGKLYGYQHFDVVPDILTSAKALGAGFPIGAMLTTAAIASHFKVGTHGSTYGGNPLACRVAETVWDKVNQPAMLQQVQDTSAGFVQHLEAINARFPIFSEIRGQGLLLGGVLNEDFKGRSRDFLNAALAQGVMILVAGADVLRFTPSLTITPVEVAQGMKALEQAVEHVYRGSAG